MGVGSGYLLREIERGADACGGIPASSLAGAGLLPHIRATVKLPMIALKRTFQQVMGGAPFLISGACGLFRVEVLRAVPLSDRTNVEDLDLTWTLVSKGYRVRQSSRCIVYSQECNSLRSEWLRWRRWIIGYAVCMRLHPRLLISRFGLFSILPMFLLPVAGIAWGLRAYSASLADHGVGRVHELVFPLALGRHRLPDRYDQRDPSPPVEADPDGAARGVLRLLLLRDLGGSWPCRPGHRA